MTSIPDITLNNGQTIPQFGFGVFQIEPKETVPAVSTALEAGYRHIDTAEMYGNEAEVGEAIARSGLDRGEVFVTSKLSNDAHEPDEARQAFEGTLKALGTEYVDLFLIHWPLPTRYGGDFVQTWRTLEEFYREGRARSIGVSNFQPHHHPGGGRGRLGAGADREPGGAAGAGGGPEVLPEDGAVLLSGGDPPGRHRPRAALPGAGPGGRA